MFTVLNSDINLVKSDLFHLTAAMFNPTRVEGRVAKVKDGIGSETKILGTISTNHYTW
jgi:hypothetical protein